ncbi:MAG: prepilin-type N-terminal cleavage/methylation domain-containing protein, partial [Gammaproteobacteria bacterium]|nr:prepilin-type N-terminal cleavage/methylation domain-containing protein [Gammaproteobacteria bacterium]
MASNTMDCNPSKGFTLVELLITIAIAIILTSTATNSFSSLYTSSAITTSINTFVAHLQLARSEAIKRGVRVVMCPSSNKTSCTGGVRWDTGFILYTDTNRNRRLDSDEVLLKTSQATHHSIQIRSTPGRKKLTFRPTGMSP